MVSLLLNYGADITLCNDKGQSVLDFAPDSMRPLLLGKQIISLFKMLNIKQHDGQFMGEIPGISEICLGIIPRALHRVQQFVC